MIYTPVFLGIFLLLALIVGISSIEDDKHSPLVHYTMGLVFGVVITLLWVATYAMYSSGVILK